MCIKISFSPRAACEFSCGAHDFGRRIREVDKRQCHGHTLRLHTLPQLGVFILYSGVLIGRQRTDSDVCGSDR